MDNNKNLSDIESELFALVNSINNLYQKYQEGIINESFFRKAIKNAMKGLLKIKLYFNEKNISLSEVLIYMNFIEQYNRAFKIFKEIYFLNSPEEFIEMGNKNRLHFDTNLRNSILELPGITSEITASFITLMDALKLEGLTRRDLILKLFKELKKNLRRFPGLETIQLEISEIYDCIINNPQNLVKNKRFRNIIGDKLYQIFKEFQQKLNLNP
ncbi:MAG: hypothetical protein ACFFDK_08480 [Promethearchaeota archaeon]